MAGSLAVGRRSAFAGRLSAGQSIRSGDLDFDFIGVIEIDAVALSPRFEAGCFQPLYGTRRPVFPDRKAVVMQAGLIPSKERDPAVTRIEEATAAALAHDAQAKVTAVEVTRARNVADR